MAVVKDMRVIKPLAKKYHLDFCETFKYYCGDAYKNNIGEELDRVLVDSRGNKYRLEYFSGCFNPFLVTI